MKSLILFLICLFAFAPAADARPMLARRAACAVGRVFVRVNDVRPHLPQLAAQAFVNRERRPVQTVIVRSFSRVRANRCN